MIILPDKYALAFLGHDVCTMRAVYSLPMLAHLEQKKTRCTQEAAVAVMTDMVQQFTADHGDKSPIFIDDTISRVQEEEKLIILPS